MRGYGRALITLGAGMTLVWGCSQNAQWFSDTFRNFASGNVVPLTPGVPSQLILVRLVNDTDTLPIEFVVTAERQVLVTDDQGNSVVETTKETVRLQTFPFESVNESGTLFDCPVTRIGLGENLDRPSTEPGLFIQEGFDEFGAGITAGDGVPANVNPLNSLAGNFGCGDTIIFRVIESLGEVGNVKVQAFVLPWVSQPTEISGSHTFNNVRNFLEEHVFEEED